MASVQAAQEPGLLFVPLAGAGEIGMNCSLYGCDGQWIMLDLGMGFDRRGAPGADVMVPDPGWIEEAGIRLQAILITHAHEDHLGAIPWLWERFRAPIHASPLAAALLRSKLEEARIQAPIHEIRSSKPFSVGPFSVEYIPMTHSVPEAHSVALHTGYGTVVHSGDWKLDPEPGVGAPSDEARLAELGRDGVLALVCDSTNVWNEQPPGSEQLVAGKLRELVHQFAGQRIIVTQFASNIARIRAVVEAAQETQRQVVLGGRSMMRMVRLATETGWLDPQHSFLSPRQLAGLEPGRTLVLCSGNQGEPKATLTRAIAGTHRDLRIGRDDVVLFSSRVIPGNERAVMDLRNALVRLGAEYRTWEDEPSLHVSGHPGAGELRRYYRHLQPRISVPVHGEPVQLRLHQELAHSCGVEHPMLIWNGDVLRMAPGTCEVLCQVPTGRLAVDGSRVISLDGQVLQERRRLAEAGAINVTILADQTGEEILVLVHSVGLAEAEARDLLEQEVQQMVEEQFRSSPLTNGQGMSATATRRLIRRIQTLCDHQMGKLPFVRINLHRDPEGLEEEAC